MKNNSHDKIQAVLIGNKSDLKDKYLCLKRSREVSKEEAEKFASTHGFSYF